MTDYSFKLQRDVFRRIRQEDDRAEGGDGEEHTRAKVAEQGGEWRVVAAQDCGRPLNPLLPNRLLYQPPGAICPTTFIPLACWLSWVWRSWALG